MPFDDSLSVSTTLKVNDGTENTIGKIQDLDGPGLEVTDIENTDYDITDKAKTFRAGNIDGGEIEATVKYEPTQHSTILGLVGKDDDGAGARTTWTITLPDTSELTGDGYVKSVGHTFASADDDGLITNTVTIKVSGLPTFTDNTGA